METVIGGFHMDGKQIENGGIETKLVDLIPAFEET